MQFAGVIRPVGGEEAGLEAEKSQRVIGAHGAAPDSPAVAVEPARHVERQPGAGHGIGLRNPAGFVAGDVARQAHPEQTVDDQAETLRRRDVRQDLPAVFAPGGPGACGIRRQPGRVGAADDGDAAALCREVPRGDQRVAAVVARAGEDQDRFARFAGQGARQFGGGRARFLHQRVVGMRVRPVPVDFADVGGGEQRR